MVASSPPQDSASPTNDAKSHKRTGSDLSSPIAKRGKNTDASTENGQQTIEECLKNVGDEASKDDGSKYTNSKSTSHEELQKREEAVQKREDALKDKEQTSDTSTNTTSGKQNGARKARGEVENESDNNSPSEKNAFDEIKADTDEVKEAAKKEQDKRSANINKNNESVVTDEKREESMPSSILEKGIIYFLFRGRVGVDEPQGLEDVARSYIVLRPLPRGAKIGTGALEDLGNSRLLALPKKMLPKSTKDRFLVFVEKCPATIKDLQDQFSGNDYATQTVGTRHTPAVTPLAEGVYAITTTGANSHLAYHITVPSQIGEVQKELGLFEKGSYNISLKNPEAPGPSYATIDNPAKYTEEIQAQFRGRRWMPVTPETLDFEGAQFLLIGEGMGKIEKAVEVAQNDQKRKKVKPEVELEKLEEEDHERASHLKEDDPIFADLGLSSKEFSHLQTTW